MSIIEPMLREPGDADDGVCLVVTGALLRQAALPVNVATSICKK